MWCRNELLLLGLLAPMCLSNLRTPYDPTIYSADASPFGLGVTSTYGGPELVQELWRRADNVGRSRVLLHRLSADLKEIGEDDFEDGLAADDIINDAKKVSACEKPHERLLRLRRAGAPSIAPTDLDTPLAMLTRYLFRNGGVEAFARSVIVGTPARPLVWTWHAIEICGGWGGIGRYMSEVGYTVVNVELKLGWDFLDMQVFNWLVHVVISGRVRFLFLEPPCTTCSLARKPGLRDSRTPWGFDLSCHITNTGTFFGVACLVLALLQMLVGNTFLLEQPAGGFMKWFPWWLCLLSFGCYEESSPQCRWQTRYPKYRKQTIFLHNDLRFAHLSGICHCVRQHILLQGSLTTLASAYPARLCKDITQSCIGDGNSGEGPWGFDVDRLPDQGKLGVENADAEGGPEEAVYRYSRPGSKQYIVSLSESFSWYCIRICTFRRQGI